MPLVITHNTWFYSFENFIFHIISVIIDIKTVILQASVFTPMKNIRVFKNSGS
jgi:hypothetical protein